MELPNSKDPNTEKKEMRVMWIMTAVIVLGLVGLTGGYMLTHPDWRHPKWAEPASQ